MTLTFLDDLPLEPTMEFEEAYEESLRISLEDKAELFSPHYGPVVDYLLVDGELAGETYGVQVAALAEDEEDPLPDLDIVPPDKQALTCYCYSTTILPAFQGRGLGHILKAHWLGKVFNGGYDLVIGHSTSPDMAYINETFGAHHVEGREHTSWYGTPRTARFYVLPL